MGYLTIFILVMVVSIYAILKLHQMNTGTRHILITDSRILDYEEKLTDSILSQLRYQKKHIITKDTTFYNQFLSAKQEFEKYFNDVFSIADTPQKKDSLSRIKTYYEHYQSLLDKEIGHVSRNKSYPKQWYEQEIEKVLDDILEELEKLETYSRHDIYLRIKKLEEAGTSARTVTIVMAAIAILLVIAVSFLITRSITKPLSLLVDKTRDVSEGVFKNDLAISSPPEMLELSKAFNSMCDKLKKVDKMKSDFFSSMSHELRTPLTSIKEGVSLLREGIGGTLSDKQQRLLMILTEESKRLINLVNSLLDLSKMEAGMMVYAFEQGSLPLLIEKALMEITPLVEAKKIIVKTEMSKDLPTLRMDQERILQVLRNLIGNAVKFTPEGRQINISIQPIDRGVKVWVEDTGPGIPKENLASIFEKFHQTPYQNSNPIKGTGLGLAIVKHIVTAHGGKVWAESEPGKGSSFIFVLPA